MTTLLNYDKENFIQLFEGNIKGFKGIFLLEIFLIMKYNDNFLYKYREFLFACGLDKKQTIKFVEKRHKYFKGHDGTYSFSFPDFEDFFITMNHSNATKLIIHPVYLSLLYSIFLKEKKTRNVQRDFKRCFNEICAMFTQLNQNQPNTILFNVTSHFYKYLRENFQSFFQNCMERDDRTDYATDNATVDAVLEPV